MSKKTVKNNVKKQLKKILIIFVLMLITLGIIALSSIQEKSQVMNNLNYDIALNADGSARIIETWDVFIYHTNTLFRNFNRNSGSNKFSNILDVTVKDLETGETLTKIDKYMYHVTDNCYYALNTSASQFEIAWGTGMESKIGRRKYQIEYTVTDVVTSYADCQEFYWKILSEENAIPVKKVTGTITMPKNVIEDQNLKVWGHGPLNGIIKATSKNKIEFKINGLEVGKMLEVRIASTDKMFNVNSNKLRNYSYLKSIIQEETKWANEANNKTNYFYYIIIGAYVIALIINIIQTVKYYKIYKRKDDGIEHTNLKYYRDIPREESATPAEAAYLYFFDKDKKFAIEHQSNMISATILNLSYKGYIRLNAINKDVYITILKGDEGLNKDEKIVYEILKETYRLWKGEFEISAISVFAKEYYYKYSKLVNKMINEVRESLYRQKLVDKAEQKLYNKSQNAKSLYSGIANCLITILIGFLITLLPIFNNAYVILLGASYVNNFITILLILFPLVSTILIKSKLASNVQNKIAVLTQKGTEEQEKWKALAKFMKDFSLIKEKEVPDITIWEKYLIYATAFDIADKVIEQMKANYPEVFVKEYWSDEKSQKYPILKLSANNILYSTHYNSIDQISKNVTTAYNISSSQIALHSSSSGSGSGGGFSGGGRWPEVVEAGMGRKIKKFPKIYLLFAKLYI